ncbi:hypothetical protein [Dactylosporangium sp. CA-139066]|uniref:hypothetical protein n=1 Tax=Dactylosporangium sp. CA-139066 TaxID=3239930 RepID=UPI003D9489C6
MVTLTGHAYCWDVLGDPAFPDRVAALGLSSVTLAAAYHSVRAATPHHPRHQIVDARHGALYRPVRPSAWRDARLRPAAADWMPSADPFAEAATTLRAAGLSVTAWIVLAHSSRLGAAFPDLAVVNCFGERYSHALCPANPEVRDYAATLAAEAIRDAPVDAVSLESCGQMGLTHTGAHDRTADAWPGPAQRWLSVCCCAACRALWSERGADPARVIASLAAAVRADSTVDSSAVLLDARQHAARLLRDQVLAAVAGVPVILHANPDPWATGPSPGLPPDDRVDAHAVLVPAWPVGEESARAVAAAVAAGYRTHAYITALPPCRAEEVPAHAAALVAAGASGINLYHLGLASAPRLEALRRTVELLESPCTP